MADDPGDLAALRGRIDAIDAELVRLVNDRARIAAQIGALKHRSGDATYAPDREREVLDRVLAANTGPLSSGTILSVYRELMSGSFALERPPRVAYLGPAGSYSHLAAKRKFGSSVDFEPLKHIGAIFDEIERGHVDLGLVPVENTWGGGVVDTLDAFAARDVQICAEINIAVQHHLLANCPLEKVQRVYSKPEVFTQCQKWLTETELVSSTIAVASSSRAAQMAAEEECAAAVGSELAAEVYGLQIVCHRIEDDPGNVTRFVVVGRDRARFTGNDKTSLLFVAADKPGSLVAVLDVFRQAGVNMTFIESRPSRLKKFEYSFFVDIEGHCDSPDVAGVIEAARAHCRSLKVLGSFPRADEIV